MKKSIVYQCIVATLTLGIWLSVAPAAHAATVTLPNQLSHAGLSFTNPLTYEGHAPNPNQNISFENEKSLQIRKGHHQQDIAAIVVTPTITPPAPTVTGTVAMPTPTIYIRSARTALASTLPVTPTIANVTQATPVPATPTIASVATPGGLNPEVLFSMVNAYRTSHGLASLQKDDKTCSLAASRAPEVNAEIANGTMHSGLRARNLPYWNTENIISMNSEQAAFNWWINDPIHHDAIVGNFTTSCVACSGNACAEEFTSYAPK